MGLRGAERRSVVLAHSRPERLPRQPDVEDALVGEPVRGQALGERVPVGYLAVEPEVRAGLEEGVEGSGAQRAVGQQAAHPVA
jgi:hypothetical protein